MTRVAILRYKVIDQADKVWSAEQEEGEKQKARFSTTGGLQGIQQFRLRS